MNTNNRLLRRIAAVAAAVILPTSVILLTPLAGHAGEEPGPIFRTDGTICWEKGGPNGQPPTVVVRLSEATKNPVTVVVDTIDGTATAPDDYARIAGLVVTVPAGASSVEVPLGIVADSVTEPDEWFHVALSKPSQGRIDKGTAVVVIKDGGPPPAAR